MIVGLDFDNTIVCYDGLFHQAAVARNLIPADMPPAKEAVRDFLRAADREAEWTELQGLVYGHEMHRAKPFAGIEAFLRRCQERQVTVNIISHRTRQPFAGPAIDLHDAARAWLDTQRWYSGAPYGLDRQRVYFEETKGAKLNRIETTSCDAFIDDLAELLDEPAFPAGVTRILFDPHATRPAGTGMQRAGSWREIADLILERGQP